MAQETPASAPLQPFLQRRKVMNLLRSLLCPSSQSGLTPTTCKEALKASVNNLWSPSTTGPRGLRASALRPQEPDFSCEPSQTLLPPDQMHLHPGPSCPQTGDHVLISSLNRRRGRTPIASGIRPSLTSSFLNTSCVTSGRSSSLP